VSLDLTRKYLDGQAIGIFGAGHMGRAVVDGLLRLGLPRNQIALCHRGTQATRHQLTTDGFDDLVVEAAQLVRCSRIVLYLVRPQHNDAIEKYRVRADSLFVSFLAGVPLKRIPVDVSDNNRMRVMTSAPDTLRRRHGIAALYATDAAASGPILEILESLGLRTVVLSQEADIHAFTALGPCLPIALAYWSSLGNTIDELEIIEVARRHALSNRDAILQWALSTHCPSLSNHELSLYLAQAVTPGGVTAAIISAINDGMRISQALDRGIERSRELASS
jgi:pyrroline-5-carboxylate reductase